MALALAAIGVGLVFTLLPPEFARSEIVWQPESSADSGTLHLTRGAPEHFEVETTCDKVRAADPSQPLLSAGTIALTVLDGDLVLAVEPYSPAVQVPLPDESCTVVGRYDLATSTVTLTAGENTATATTEAPQITGLVATGSTPAISRVDLSTQPTAITTSWFRWYLGLLTLAFAGISFFLIARNGGRDQRARVREQLPRLLPIDGFVLVSLLALALVVPALFDDGWILVRSQSLVERGWFGNIYTTNDAWLPQGFLHEGVLGWLQQAGLRFVHLKLLMAVVLTVSWVILRHYVLAATLGRRDSQRVVAAAVFTAFSGAWLITIRAEPVVVLLGTLTLAACVSMERRPRPTMFAIGIATGALTIGAHQSGWVALGPVLFLVHLAVRAVRTDRRQSLAYIAAAGASGAVSLLTVFAAVDLRTAVSGGREFSGSSGYTSGILSEPGRYVGLLNGDNTSARVFTVMLLAALALSAALSTGSGPGRRRLWLLSFAWIGGLLLTASKWPWHLGVYAIPATVFAALTADAWHRRGPRLGMGRAALLPLVTLLAAMALTYGGRWGEADLFVLTWPELSEFVVGGSRRYGWYAAVLCVAALGLAADRGRLRLAATVVLVLAIVTPLLVNMLWVIRDAREPGWSFAGSTVRQLSGGDACGVLSDEEIVVGADLLLEAATTSPRRSKHGRGLAPDAFPRVQGVTTGPLDDEIPAWGTWFTDDGDTGPDAQTGSMSSPEYALHGNRDLTVWTVAGTTDGLAVHAVFYDDERVVQTSTLPLVATQGWALHTFSPPADATSVRMEIDDASTAYGGWAAVSVPGVAETASAASVFEEANGYTSPFQLTQFPCVSLPELDEGYWGRTDYAVKTDFYFGPSIFHGLTATQVLCMTGRECVSELDYELAEVTVYPRG